MELLHGHPVRDPYRWLEDGDSDETQAWVAAQNARTRAVLDAIPGREALRERMLALLKTGTAAAPAAAADRLFHLERHGSLDQAVLVMRSAEDPDSPPRLVVDPHDLATDHTAAIDWFAPSPDGRLVAYGISESGSERGTLRIVEVDTERVLPDAIAHVRHPSVAWLPDGSAFAYSRLPDPATVPAGEASYWERLWWHEVGSDPADDELLVGEGLARTALPIATISPDGRWLVVHVHLMPTRTDVILIDRSTGARTVVVEGEEAATWCQVVDDRLYAVTNLDAPRGRVVSAPTDAPRSDQWRTIVPETPAVIEAALIAGEWLLVASSEHAVSRLHRYRLSDLEGRAPGTQGPSGPSERGTQGPSGPSERGTQGPSGPSERGTQGPSGPSERGTQGPAGAEVELPGLGSITGLGADPARARAFLSFTSFADPATIWRWTADGGIEPWVRFPAPDPASDHDIVVEQVFYSSTDGTRIPMFLVRAASTAPSRSTPTVLSGYGGFAIPSAPVFSPGVVAFCEAGGVYALAGIRGGGEYGEDWHRGGMLANKEHVFDDFCAAADWLVAEGHTSRERLAIRGGSNGGLLVGAAITRRPDLCRAAVCAVPLLDMLRYHRFRLGSLWTDEYGDPEDPEEFAVLAAYSPYHHVAGSVAYPATLLTAAESDTRVDPMHAVKFAARLQAAQAADDRPVLLRVETRAGHGQGKPAWKQADELADTWAFTVWQLGGDDPMITTSGY